MPHAFSSTAAAHLQKIVRQNLSDKGPGTDFALYVALGLQLLKRRNHGGAGEFVFVSQVPCSGQPGSWRDPAVQYRGSQFVVEPAVEGRSRRGSRKVQGQ